MSEAAPLIGRGEEQAALTEVLAATREGSGGVLLLAGEGGVGKTRLAEESLAASGVAVLRGGTSDEATPPFGPLVAVLRAHLRDEPDGFAECGPLARYLALLLPELGAAPRRGDRETLVEAVVAALRSIARRRATAVFLDDLHAADRTTLELLTLLAGALERERLLVLGAYRSDEMPRGHPLRRLRQDLRRAGRLRELALEPLDREGTTALAEHVLGRPLSRTLAAAFYDRTQGSPFFTEELAVVLAAGGRLHDGPRGLELAAGAGIPLPDTVRDTVLLRAEALATRSRRALEVAAVAGPAFELALVAELSGGAGLGEAIERRLVVELGDGRGAFRHALTREALYGDVAWTRRRTIHRRIAERLEAGGAPPGIAAEHWLAARNPERALPLLLQAVEAALTLYAYRDAAQAARRALELWPEGEDEPARLALLERLGDCAELCGDLAEAVRAWGEAAQCRRALDQPLALAQVERRLASAFDLLGSSERALGARRAAADAFLRCDLRSEAATEWLTAAVQLDSAGTLQPALELASRARTEARNVDRRDLELRAAGVEGSVTAKLGDLEAGKETVRAALETALAENRTAVATDLYQRLANTLENAASWRQAGEIYATAHAFCEARGEPNAGQVCLVCLACVLLHTGEWTRSQRLYAGAWRAEDAPLGLRMAGKQGVGLILAARGDGKRARPLIAEPTVYARQHGRLRVEFWGLLGLCWIDELEGDADAAADRSRHLLDRWRETEDRHYSLPALRWATTFFSRNGYAEDARACAQALTRIAAATSSREAPASLAHALGELALLDDEPEQAAVHLVKAGDILRELELPFEHAQTDARAGAALAAAGDRETGLQRLTDAYRAAQKLRARPLAARISREVEQLGERVDRRLGRRAAGDLERAGLTRRELEIVRLVAVGRTNREIARDLFLSPRTVEMHVHNILGKLGCRSRTEAAHRAGELGLMV